MSVYFVVTYLWWKLRCATSMHYSQGYCCSADAEWTPCVILPAQNRSYRQLSPAWRPNVRSPCLILKNRTGYNIVPTTKTTRISYFPFREGVTLNSWHSLLLVQQLDVPEWLIYLDVSETRDELREHRHDDIEQLEFLVSREDYGTRCESAADAVNVWSIY